MEFASSKRGSLGVEWELSLVDPETRQLTAAAPELLARADDRRIAGEFMQNTVELITGVHGTVGEAIDEIDQLRRRLLAICDDAGVAPIGSGTHPFSDWRDQVVNEGERYRHVTERSGDWGRQLAIWGVHTHVGVEDRSKVVPIMHGVLAHYPLIHALAASSPYWLGEDTTFGSHRAMVFQQLPTGGLPPDLESWADLERVCDDFLRTGIVDVLGELRWDVRPAMQFGTVEIRIADGATRIDDLAAITALSHVMVEHVSRHLDACGTGDRLPAWFVRENKWRASRYGLETIMIETPQGDERLVTEVLEDRLDDWAHIADDLGCAREFASIEDLVRRGSSADRQRAVAAANGGDLRAVVDALVAELRLPPSRS